MAGWRIRAREGKHGEHQMLNLTHRNTVEAILPGWKILETSRKLGMKETKQEF